MPDFKELQVSSSPHIRAPETINWLMWQVVLALMPAVLCSIYFFGLRSLVVISLGISSAIATEAAAQKVLGKQITVFDGSAVITGLLLSLNLPANVPWWIVVLGSIFAIAVVKQTFGGLGCNFINPALTARAFLLAAWPKYLTGNFPLPISGLTGATPLAILEGSASGALPSYINLFVGNIGGVLGETSAIALIIGGLYLIWRQIIDWRVPVAFISTVALLAWIFGGHTGLFGGDPLYHVLAGGLMLGAFYMATDYVTSPVTPNGRLVFGAGCGFITVLIRIWGGYPEGVSYSILLMNLLVPFIERWTAPRIYGYKNTSA